jgi:hypothetical protein
MLGLDRDHNPPVRMVGRLLWYPASPTAVRNLIGKLPVFLVRPEALPDFPSSILAESLTIALSSIFEKMDWQRS